MTTEIVKLESLIFVWFNDIQETAKFEIQSIGLIFAFDQIFKALVFYFDNFYLTYNDIEKKKCSFKVN